jgi:hypothetical protein
VGFDVHLFELTKDLIQKDYDVIHGLNGLSDFEQREELANLALDNKSDLVLNKDNG